MRNLKLENRTKTEITFTTNVYFNAAKSDALSAMQNIVNYCNNNNICVMCNNEPDGLGTSNMVRYNFIVAIPNELQHLVSNTTINSRTRIQDTKNDLQDYVESKINELENIYNNAKATMQN